MIYTEATLPNDATRIIHLLLKDSDLKKAWLEQLRDTPKQVLALGNLIDQWVTRSLAIPIGDPILNAAAGQVNCYELAAFWLELEKPQIETEPTLTDWHRNLLRKGTFNLKLNFSGEIDCFERSDRVVGTTVSADIQIVLPDMTQEVIGHVIGYRTKGFVPSDVLDYTSELRPGIYDGFKWLFQSNIQGDGPVLFVDLVWMKEHWRGMRLSLLATAAFIETMDAEFIFLKPAPLTADTDVDFDAGCKKLKAHWSKLGCNKSQGDYLYTQNWKCPARLLRRAVNV